MNVKIEPLQIDPSDLNTKRMLDLMAVNQDDGSMPLYLHTLYRILREMRIKQQKNGTKFDYQRFTSRLKEESMSPGQLGPLNQRLDLLGSFMPDKLVGKGNDWTSVVRQIDASFTCVTKLCSLAASLLSICHVLA